ncbi:MAG: hypothetical protein RLY97_2159 [Pseudomonadota bacterium]
MSNRLAGKLALITGAAQGLGAAMAHAMAAQGARLMLTDLNADGVAEQARAINAIHGHDTAHSCRHDVTSQADWTSALELTQRHMGGLSVLVNNAGIGAAGTVESTSLANWHRAFAVNVDSVFLGCKLAMPLLRASQPASIINISSVAGLVASPMMAAYHASKAAVWMLTKSVALECAKAGDNIRCNSVHPAYVDTPILEGFQRQGSTHEATVNFLARGIPMRRVGAPDEVAHGVVYLASDESSFMTGAELKIDGGLTAT